MWTGEDGGRGESERVDYRKMRGVRETSVFKIASCQMRLVDEQTATPHADAD